MHIAIVIAVLTNNSFTVMLLMSIRLILAYVILDCHVKQIHTACYLLVSHLQIEVNYVL